MVVGLLCKILPISSKFVVCCYFCAKHNTSLHFKIVNGGGNFVRYAVAESAAYLAYVSIYATSKVQNLPTRTIFKKRDAFLTKRISCI